jgi:hypothetical protein
MTSRPLNNGTKLRGWANEEPGSLPALSRIRSRVWDGASISAACPGTERNTRQVVRSSGRGSYHSRQSMNDLQLATGRATERAGRQSSPLKCCRRVVHDLVGTGRTDLMHATGFRLTEIPGPGASTDLVSFNGRVGPFVAMQGRSCRCCLLHGPLSGNQELIGASSRA